MFFCFFKCFCSFFVLFVVASHLADIIAPSRYLISAATRTHLPPSLLPALPHLLPLTAALPYVHHILLFSPDKKKETDQQLYPIQFSTSVTFSCHVLLYDLAQCRRCTCDFAMVRTCTIVCTVLYDSMTCTTWMLYKSWYVQ